MWSDAMGQGEKAYPFVCPECGEEVRGNERHFSIQPLLNRIMLTIEGNRTSIGEELERFITVYASFGAEFLSSPLQTVQCETAKPERAQLTSLKISMESLLNQMEVQMQLEKGILRKIVHYQQVEGGNLADKYQDLYRDVAAGKTLSREDSGFLFDYAQAHDKILKNIRSRDLSNNQVREQELNEFLDILMTLCSAESKDHKGMSVLSTRYQIMAAWCFKVDATTKVAVPDMLYLELSDEHGTEVCSSKEACCPHCRKAEGLYMSFGVFGH